jgi:hypothetical protein
MLTTDDEVRWYPAGALSARHEQGRVERYGAGRLAYDVAYPGFSAQRPTSISPRPGAAGAHVRAPVRALSSFGVTMSCCATRRPQLPRILAGVEHARHLAVFASVPSGRRYARELIE